MLFIIGVNMAANRRILIYWILSKQSLHKEVTEAIEEYIGFYNTKRSHSYNNYQSPIEAELKWWRTHFRDVA